MRSRKYFHLPAIIPENFIAQLHQRAETTLLDIYHDYFSKTNFEEFKSSHLAHNGSLVMQIATFRFASAEILTKLRNLVIPHICQSWNEAELLFHPICYLRFNFPGNYYSDKQQTAFLATEPHYDHYNLADFCVRAMTFWVALEDVNKETGGLCLFSKKKIRDYFTTASGGVRYDYKTYLEISQDVDYLLRSGTVRPTVNVGDVLALDSTVLHGGTKPISRRRVSFDFRLVPKSNLEGAPAVVHRFFNQLNSQYDIYNANNLIRIGDFLGASRILHKVSNDTGNWDLRYVAVALKSRLPNPAIFQERVL